MDGVTTVRSEASLGTILPGRITEMRSVGEVQVRTGDGRLHECRVLSPAVGCITVGDEVLIWHQDDEGTSGVVLGRISEPGARAASATSAPTPETLVLEARENLTLRCGDGSITIRKDGKILIKGKDLVSHAKRANRIRGGSVAIN